MAVSFSNDNLLRTASLPAWNAFSACGWARRGTDRGTYSTLFSLEASGGSAYLVLQANDDGDSLIVYRSGAGGPSSAVATLSDGTNFFWAITSDGTNVRIYYAAEGAASLSLVTAAFSDSFTPASMYVGNNSFGEYWEGDVGYVKVWGAVLSQAELELERRQGHLVRTANINIFSPLLAADSVTDFSGNGRNWTLTGAVPLAQNFPVPWRRGRQKVVHVTAAGPATQTIDPAGFAARGVYGPHAVTPGDVTVSPGSAVGRGAFGAFALSPGAVDLSMGSLVARVIFGAVDVALSPDQTLSPDSVVAQGIYGSFTLAPGAVSITFDGHVARVASGSFTVTPGEVTLTFNGLAARGIHGAIDVIIVISPDSAVARVQYGNITVAPGTVTLSPDSLVARTAIGDFVVSLEGEEAAQALYSRVTVNPFPIVS
jgi:hypothetical protein